MNFFSSAEFMINPITNNFTRRRGDAKEKIKLQVAGFKPEAMQGILLRFAACLCDSKKQAVNSNRSYFSFLQLQISLSLRLRVRNE
jgi:hypothetical protein